MVNKDRSHKIETQTPLKQRLACSVGNVYNDFIRSTTLSFALVYYIRVAGLSSNQSGIVVACGLFSASISVLVFGYCSDKVELPYLSQRLGRRKVWHLLWTILIALSFMLAFSRCIICSGSSSPVVAFGYFTFVYGMVCILYGGVETVHLSIIPDIAKNYNETVTLNAIRQVYECVGHVTRSCKGATVCINWKNYNVKRSEVYFHIYVR